MSEEKLDMAIGLGTEYDGTGAREAKEDIRETAKATEEAAASTAQAAQEGSAASDKEAERQKQLAEMMRLTMMTRRELREEILRLIAAQKSAAAANDTKRYEQLTTSINRAKEALEKLNTAQQVGMIAMQQQAQTGMQFAQGLGSMKAAAAQGTAGLATMATQAMALGMAIKAGLGPIGWVMAALQGLGMIVTHFSEQSKKEAEAIKAATKALEEQSAALDKNAEAHEKNAAAQAAADADDRAEAIDKAAKKELDALREKNRGAQEERRKDIDQRRRAAEMARKEDAEAVQAGRMDAAEASARDQMRQEKVEAAEKDAEAQAAAEEKKLLDKERETGKKLLKERQKTLSDLTKGLSNEDLAILSIEDKALQQLVSRFDEARAREQQQADKVKELERQADEDGTDASLQAYLAAADNLTELEQERRNLEQELVARTREQVKVLETAGRLDAETTAGKAAEAVAIISGMNAAQDAVEKQEVANRQLDQKIRELLRQQETLQREKQAHDDAAEAAERQADSAQQTAALAEGWKAVQQKNLTEQITWLEAQLRQMEKGSQLWVQYNDALNNAREQLLSEQWGDVQKQGYAAQKAWLEGTIANLEEDTRLRGQYSASLESVNQAMLAEQWATVQQEKSLQEQAAWLQTQLGQIQQGSKLWEEYNAALKNVNTRSIQEALGNLEKDFKVTGSYTARDRRMQGEILAADGRALAARAQRLRQLMAETNDYDLRRQLQEQLDETVKQQRGLAEATRQAAQEARKSLKNYAPPEFQSKNRMVQRNLDNTAHAYARLAKTAERQAEAGNTKGLERTKRLMQNYADRLGRLGHDQQKANDLFRRDADLLDQIAASDSKRKKHADKREKAERKSADASKKQADLKDAQSAPDKAAQEQQDTKAALENARAALEQNEKALGEMQARVAEALALAARVAGAAESIAKAAGKSVAALKKRCTALEKDVENLWSEVDA